MNANDVVKLLDDSIRTGKEAGVTTVSIQRLEALAAEISKIVQQSSSGNALTEPDLERYKAKLAAWVVSQQHIHEWKLEMLRSVISTGQSALKSSLLINGAAAVALLAFIGNIWSPISNSPTVAEAANALAAYAFGILIAAVAAGFTYVSQAGYANEFGKNSRVVGVTGHIGAVICVVISYVAFGYASYLAYRVFTCPIG